MAEGGAEDIVLGDLNGSFQNQSEEATTSKQSSRCASVENVSLVPRPYFYIKVSGDKK